MDEKSKGVKELVHGPLEDIYFASNTAEEAYVKVSAAQTDGMHIFQDTVSRMVCAAADYNSNVLEMARVHFNAMFDYAGELLGVRSVSDAVGLWSARSRTQFEQMTEQGKQLAALTQHVTAQVGEPMRDGAIKAFSRSLS